MKAMNKKTVARPRIIHHGLSGMARLQASHIQRKRIGQILRNNTTQYNDKYEQQAAIQAKSNAGLSPEMSLNKLSPILEDRIQSLKGGGQALPSPERKFFEPRMGVALDDVRVHSDANAAHIAKSINAKAFTRGRDVVFAQGQYSSGTHSGRQLLAHELTHVVQQSGANSENSKPLQQAVKRTHRRIVTIQKSQTISATIQRWLASEHTAIGDEAYQAFSNFHSNRSQVN